MDQLRCFNCQVPLHPALTWWEVSGYEQDRSQGGTNHLKNRQRTGRALCNACVHVKSPGEQGSLLG